MTNNKVNVELIKLSEALAIAKDDNATEEQIASALIVVNKVYRTLGATKSNLEDKIKAFNLAKQQQLELVYSNFDEGVGVITEQREHHIVDMVGIHKDAKANISVTYSDTVYEQVFTPNVRANKKAVIKLAEEGVLPNASKRVKKVTVEQAKLFDFKEPTE